MEEYQEYLRVKAGDICIAIPEALFLGVVTDCPIARVMADNLWVRGVICYHEELLPVFDFSGRLKKVAAKGKAYLICDFKGEKAAFVVSEIEEHFLMKEGEEQGDEVIVLEETFLERMTL